MADRDAAFTGSMPALYDRYLGPMIFEPYAEDLAARVASRSPSRVLETAAGTGILTRRLAAMLSASTITATDLSPEMIRLAAASVADPRVSWHQADALALAFDDASFDAVVCQFGVMFFPDKSRGFHETRRVLQPKGCFIFSVWDRIEANEIPHEIERALTRFFPDDPPRFISRIPHGYYDIAAIRLELQRAGFEDIQCETITKTVETPSAHEAALGFCTGTPIRMEIEARDVNRREEALEASIKALETRFGGGPISSKMQAHVFTAIR